MWFSLKCTFRNMHVSHISWKRPRVVPPASRWGRKLPPKQIWLWPCDLWPWLTTLTLRNKDNNWNGLINFYTCFPDDVTKKQKVSAIQRVLRAQPVDVPTLCQFAISRGGLLTDKLRLRVWPKLLKVDLDDIPPKPGINLNRTSFRKRVTIR